ncbi:MAG: sugar phosphate isomerase/epimerase [Acidobacteriota bacterium]|nr:sugar phosphate isomerase/epimerase [Acidobacteriota bacterium]
MGGIARRLPAGLAPLTVGRPSLEVLVDAADAAGFARVGVTLWAPGHRPARLCADAATQRAAVRTVRRSGVHVLDVGVVTLEPGLDLDDLRRVIDAAGALGADRLVAMNVDPSPTRAAATLAAVCAEAAPAGLAVAVEFMPYTATKTLAAACDLVLATGHAGAGIVVDALHLHRSGGTPAGLASRGTVPVLLAQICDARREPPPPDRLRAEALSDRLYPGQGDLPLAELLAALPAGVPITVEAPVAADVDCPPRERARRAAAGLARLLPASPLNRSDGPP